MALSRWQSSTSWLARRLKRSLASGGRGEPLLGAVSISRVRLWSLNTHSITVSSLSCPCPSAEMRRDMASSAAEPSSSIWSSEKPRRSARAATPTRTIRA